MRMSSRDGQAAHHVFGFLWQERCRAGAIFALDVLLDEAHLEDCLCQIVTAFSRELFNTGQTVWMSS